ncbi:MAG: hypothetical protein HYU66_29520 [Armatimonadetes bacterium]|nr:hypothetical protein [Armatimonadota bacterium]
MARRLRLLDPFEGAEAEVAGAELRREGGRFEGELSAGQEVTLALSGTGLDAAEVLARIGREGGSRFGLR